MRASGLWSVVLKAGGTEAVFLFEDAEEWRERWGKRSAGPRCGRMAWTWMRYTEETQDRFVELETRAAVHRKDEAFLITTF